MQKSQHILSLRHYLVLAVAAFTVGIVIATTAGISFLSTTVVYLLAILGVATLLMIFGKFLFKKHSIPQKSLLLPIFLIVFILLGIFRIIGANLLFPSALDSYVSKGTWLTGKVISEPTLTTDELSAYFQMEVFEINDKSISPEKIMLFAPKERGLKLSTGDRICCWTEINQQEYDSESWPYNYQTHLRSNGIFHSGSIKNANPAEFREPDSAIRTVKNFGESTANSISDAVDSLPVPQTNGNILKGILVGDKSDFSDSLYQSFSFAGLSHIVAVSGMHLSILFSAISLLLGALKVRKRISLLLTVPIIILFAATARFTPSVCRAAIMILMMLIAAVIGKRYSPINALFLSLGIILCVSPYSVYSRSLTLSFGATLGILVYYKYIHHFLCLPLRFIKCRSDVADRIISKIYKFIVSSLSISLSVTVTTSYFSLLFFGSVPWVQALTNIWIIPVVTAAFCLGYIACILSFIIPPLATVISYPLNFFLDIIAKTATTFGQSSSTFTISNTNFPWTYFVVYAGFAILLYLILKKAYDLSVNHGLSTTSDYIEPGISKL